MGTGRPWVLRRVSRDGCSEAFVHLEKRAGIAQADSPGLGLPGSWACLDLFGACRDDGLALLALRSGSPAADEASGWTALLPGRADGSDSLFAWSVSGPAVSSVRLGGRTVGRCFDDGLATWCRLGGLLPCGGGSPAEQARSVLAQARQALGEVGMDFHHVVRTWFYNDDILSWYPEFNEARTVFFRETGVLDRGFVPASTGIGASNPAGSALTAGLLALKPRDGRVRVAAVPSPLQCAASSYGSVFSRAVEIATPDHRRLLVSGTASIDAGGATVHGGDFEGQVERTMEVVEALLASREMEWPDVVRSVAYVRHPEHLDLLDAWLSRHPAVDVPMLQVQAQICRSDLLFELELDALRVEGTMVDR